MRKSLYVRRAPRPRPGPGRKRDGTGVVGHRVPKLSHEYHRRDRDNDHLELLARTSRAASCDRDFRAESATC